jgi:hypothetical protein
MPKSSLLLVGYRRRLSSSPLPCWSRGAEGRRQAECRIRRLLSRPPRLQQFLRHGLVTRAMSSRLGAACHHRHQRSRGVGHALDRGSPTTHVGTPAPAFATPAARSRDLAFWRAPSGSCAGRVKTAHRCEQKCEQFALRAWHGWSGAVCGFHAESRCPDLVLGQNQGPD